MVINVKDAPANWTSNNKYVYVGRQSALQTIDFGNPYRISGKYDRVTVISRYIQWLTRELQCNDELQQTIASLDGKILVCHCHPLACHGDVLEDVAAFLSRLIDATPPELGGTRRWVRECHLSAFMKELEVRWSQKVISAMGNTARKNLKDVTDYESFKKFRQKYLSRMLKWSMPDYVAPENIVYA